MKSYFDGVGSAFYSTW